MKLELRVTSMVERIVREIKFEQHSKAFLFTDLFIHSETAQLSHPANFSILNDAKRDFLLRTRNLSICNASFSDHVICQKSVATLEPVKTYPHIQTVELKNSTMTLNSKTLLPSLSQAKLAQQSTLRLLPSANFKHLQLDNYQTPQSSLLDAQLETVDIDATSSQNEGLIMLDKLIKFGVCANNKQTTVSVDTLYTPWQSQETHATELTNLLTPIPALSGKWQID